MANQNQRGRTSNRPGYNSHLKEWCYEQVRLALKDGWLKRMPFCDNCSKRCLTESHHKDYSKPYEIEWLCDECHRNRHIIHRSGSLMRRLYDEFEE